MMGRLWIIPLLLTLLIPPAASGSGPETFPPGASQPITRGVLDLPSPFAPRPKPYPLLPEEGAGVTIRVVIDPGHGGDDWGCIGTCKLLEKDLVLDIGKRLFDYLGADPLFEPLLTRDDDRFIPLSERKVFALEHKADFFVSIHANSGKRLDADGPEVFFLSLTASDRAAMQVAVRENLGVPIEDETFNRHPELESVLQDLAQTDALKKSSLLAELTYHELYASLPGEWRGVKQAPFIVLHGIGIPAVLIEVSFLSNPDDCYLMTTGYGREIVARAIERGLRTFGLILAEEIIQEGRIRATGRAGEEPD